MPYTDFSDKAFWKRCREDNQFLVSEIYQPKFQLLPGARIATAGSCFAQNIAKYVRASELEWVNVEPAPKAMPIDVASRFGYGLFSARYGNIYTVRQLLQLLQDMVGETLHKEAIWERNGRYFDAIRPNVEPQGFESSRELCAHRLDHLRRVRRIFDEAEVFVFTLGLTETWQDRETGIVFPTVPGLFAGNFDAKQHEFVNFGFDDTYEDLASAIHLMHKLNPQLKILLTVSPVPLTATASGYHVLQATTYSKSVLRTVAGEIVGMDDRIDYFPSYELITGTPFSGKFFGENLRTVTQKGVQNVMAVFFGAHIGLSSIPSPEPEETLHQGSSELDDELVCEEALLESFTKA
ncbi:GSCFA family protein [Sulfitobacter sp. JL08]|uniref:GSCFA domain-containing protein n=1 Tax=Sulfitobacter sp. JL08 TaxID=2070369 RepID=UPI000E0C7A40|nr:GSCFA domain-containing protein [Sulfitobacter sp. JL08]AXI54851.1 GSCFA family protein [Sulfitobacter sp. JL08]